MVKKKIMRNAFRVKTLLAAKSTKDKTHNFNVPGIGKVCQPLKKHFIMRRKM
jgi:hypothetical protein